MRRAIISCAAFVAAAAIGGRGAYASITFTPIGNPIWQAVGGVQFSAPIGTGDDGYNEFFTTQQAILPPPNSQFNPTNGQIIPGAPHPGPYNSEVITGVAAQGYKTGSVYNASDFSNGKGIWLGLEYVPNASAPSGYSPDSANGPIIPNSLFDINYSGETDRNGVLFDPNWTGSVLSVNEAEAGVATTSYAGFSHFPQFWAESIDFGPGNVPADGNYTETFTLLDTTGNGWILTNNFTVVPEPSSLGLALFAGVGLLRRRPARAQK
jgi:hypothetical protein